MVVDRFALFVACCFFCFGYVMCIICCVVVVTCWLMVVGRGMLFVVYVCCSLFVD